MRVAIRRQRAALRLFRDSLPPRVLGLRMRLRRIASALGQVRDLDVHLATLEECKGELEPPDRVALEALCERLVRSRDAARRKMLAHVGRPALHAARPTHDRSAAWWPVASLRSRTLTHLSPGPGAGQSRYDRVIKLAQKLGAKSTTTEFHGCVFAARPCATRSSFTPTSMESRAENDPRSGGAPGTPGEHQDVNVAANVAAGIIQQRGSRLGRQPPSWRDGSRALRATARGCGGSSPNVSSPSPGGPGRASRRPCSAKPWRPR